MYLGIDLGTSNSAIYGNTGDALRLFKTSEGTDVLRSAIMLDRRGQLLVGKRAYDQAAFSPENVQQGFKRLMGTSSPVRFAAANREMSPEDASSEIIKALLGQARAAAGDFEIEGAVITIPAAFNQMQSEATMRAAEAAGLTRVGLLQEPVAAAMAAIAGTSNKNGQFLVYDLGGGTFDVAIVQSVGGAVNVVAHAGINMLGGRDFDRALIDNVVRPWLAQNFHLPESFQTDPRYKRILSVAQYRAEITKIALSTQTTDRIFADENQVGVQDLDGNEVYLDVEVHRSDLERLVVENLDRTIELCRHLITDNSYNPDDIDRIVFIGGPSMMPITRERVSHQLGIAADLKTDPMTAVAMGAAIFAEGRDWSGSVSKAKATRGSARSTGAVELRYDYPARTADSRVRLRVRPAPDVELGHRVQVSGKDGWTSGQVEISGTTAINDIPVPNNGANDFEIIVYDPTGAVVPNAGAKISIMRAGSNAGGIPATKTIGVKVLEGLHGFGRNSLLPLLEKGTILPNSGTLQLRAAKDLRSGGTDSIDFDLYEIEDGVDDPELSLNIGMFRILPGDLEQGDIIRRGDEINCHWQMSDSNILTCKLEVPAISKTFDSGRMYVPTSGAQNFEGAEGDKIASAMVNQATSDLNSLKDMLGSVANDDAADLSRRIDKQRAALEGSWEADTRRSITEEARAIRQDIARVRNRPEFMSHKLGASIRQFRNIYENEVRQFADDRTKARVHRLIEHAEEAVNRGTPSSLKDAEASLKEAWMVIGPVLRESPVFVMGYYESVRNRRELAADKALHDRLVEQAEAAILADDIQALRAMVVALDDNLISVPIGGEAAELAGLMRR
ncbi:Hsp70 family protein [Aureimonas frigidaquae]|uniref:Heat shock protein 70 n=1 Tax=Aureimonas frigidaquae TaxID=424757 RepID=A0A0N7KXN5_9HYPH|nr:Hsp70 family protein [Aureimonas frigidaquae]BAT27417.1 heat shock protein 70 [Aureimonas frigidaquae]